jgi:two-component system, chemotaxis family, sensor kinase CheA
VTPRDEVVRVFLAETHENLDRVENTLIELEKNPGNREPIAGIFRAFHCLKGTSGFLAFGRLEGLAHAAEALLSAIRDGQVAPGAAVIETLLEVVDAVRRALIPVARDGREAEMEFQGLIDSLGRLQEARPAPAPALSPAPTPAAAAAREAESSIRPAGKVRVDVGLLDKLMNLVGELVLARNQIQRTSEARETADQELAGAVQRLSFITGELQEGVMKARMQPVSVVWDHFPRIVRDVANACGKKVRLEMEGIETELDRGIIEAIGDPLVHLLRNAVDHGIEAPPRRAERGKSEEGVLQLRAYHEGGQVVIQISDDGGGIQTPLLRVKALKARLITPEVAARMNDREALQLIFLRGVTTAEKITHLSGRGVGMDIVRANIEKVGGTIEVRSRRGEGTVFLLRMPLTLAIIPALIATCGGERFAIPRPAVRELVRLEGQEDVERVHDALVTRLRGQLLPLVKLDALLGLAPPKPGPVHILVVHAHGRPFGLVVDAVLDTQDIVVKPVAARIKEIGLYQGATILGDGRVALILDVVALADRGGLTDESHDLIIASRPAPPPAPPVPKNVLLLVGNRDGGRMALPLGSVTRLEEFGAEAVERAGGQEMVQYRGQILPLIPLELALPERRGRARQEEAEARFRRDETRLQVVVHERRGRPVGLVVHRILDIVEEDLAAPRPPSRKGIKCCAVIREKVTEVVDLDEVLAPFDVRQEEAR